MTDLQLRTTAFEEDVAIDAMHDTATDNWAWDAKLRADVAEAIRRFPNTEAQHWIGPEAVLAVVERFLTDGLREVADGLRESTEGPRR